MISKEVKAPVICWWSGGVTSAAACKLAIDYFGKENCIVVFIDTFNEDADTYRFKADCVKWYGLQIVSISNPKYKNIQEVWYKYLSLNVANGAICSTVLKREVREQFQREMVYSYQVFGFEIEEVKRAKAMKLNYPDSKPIFPLIYNLLSKKDCINILREAGIQIPKAYKSGFLNNNCRLTGCVQGGIGYWQKMKIDEPDKFLQMASVEHELTDLKGKPVTMLKDQSKAGGLVFLLPHPKYPTIKDISMIKGRPVKPLVDCNGFCGVNDLSPKTGTEHEINFSL